MSRPARTTLTGWLLVVVVTTCGALGCITEPEPVGRVPGMSYIHVPSGHGLDRERTTGADSAAILADFRRRFSDEFGGIGSDRIRVVLPGNESGAYRVLVCEDADEAAACLHRHWLESQGRAPGRRSRRPANATRRRSFTDIAAAAGSHIQVGTCASVASGCRMTSTLLPGSCWRRTISTHSPLRGWNR